MPTRVYITCDVECSEERAAGARILPPIGYDMRVWGRFSADEREHGIGFMMSELEAVGLRATFFVEALGAEYFGDAGLRQVCAELRGRGHDVQLHLHPILRAPRWLSSRQAPVADDIGDYAVAEQIALLRDGIAILSRCGVPPGELCAFRAGNFGAASSTWEAMAAVGLRVSSSYNPFYFGQSCKIDWPRTEQSLFDTGRGVWELPVTCFSQPGGGPRHLQIAAASTAEIVSTLEQAIRFGLPEVTLVTHPFEFFHIDSADARRGRPNRINQARFRQLCRYLARRSEALEVETVSDLAKRLPIRCEQLPIAPLVGRRRDLARRLVEQAAKRIDARIGPLLGLLRSTGSS